jgi:hypothetical protein
MYDYIYMCVCVYYQLFGWGNHHASYPTSKEARVYVAYMTRLMVHNMHKLLKKMMKHELSYCKTRLKVHSIHQLLKAIMKRETQLPTWYNII